MLTRKETTDATSGLYGSNDAMHLWHGAEFTDSPTREQGPDGSGTGRQYYGPYSHDQHHAFRDVYVACKSYRSRSNRRRPRRTYANAVHTEYAGSLGAWSAYRSFRQLPYPRQLLAIDVHVGWSDYIFQRRADDRRRSVILYAILYALTRIFTNVYSCGSQTRS